MDVYLGVDLGAVTTKLAVVSGAEEVLCSVYSRTQGKPIAVVQEGLRRVKDSLSPGVEIRGVGATGSARHLAGVLLGADVVKNEITSHAVATLRYVPGAQTIFEIGGQDSKIILLREGFATDFAMNSVCAAGTGSFLDHQATRLGMSIEEFAEKSLQSTSPVRIAGQCTVFAESDMIHKQQMGHPIEDILYGLCQALARNYLNSVAVGKPILSPVVFQGGVAFNKGMVRAFEEELGAKIIVPPHHEVMGAIGAALLAREEMGFTGGKTSFKRFDVSEANYQGSSFECKACPSSCEIAQICLDGGVVGWWGGRCDMWDRVPTGKA